MKISDLLKFMGVSDSKHGTTGTIWNLPNYDGELYTADQVNTPFLSLVGGLNGGLQTNNFEFPTASLYTLPDADQPEITETDSLTAPTASQVARTQEKNVVQIFQESIDISYVKLSNSGRLSGINTAGAQNNIASERDWQILKKLEKIARDVNYTFYNGTYQIATDAAVANKTRGMFAFTEADTVIDAQGAELDKAMLNALFLEMFEAGATFKNVVLFLGGLQKQKVTNIYTVLPQSRNVGGSNIEQIMTDFGPIGIQVDRMVPNSKIGCFDLSVIAPVFCPVPEKGNLFYEPLAKTGAAEKGQLFGQLGLDHGPSFMHGSIKDLKTTS